MNNDYPAGYGVSDREGYTPEDYANGTSIWHVHQDIMRNLEDERQPKHFAPDPFEIDNGFDYDAPLFGPIENKLPSSDEKNDITTSAVAVIPRTPKLGKNSYAMSPHILCSSLFAITTRPKKITAENGEHQLSGRVYYEKTLFTMNGASVEYWGKELWQEDLSVLLGLLKLAQDKSEAELQEALADPAKAIQFAPTSFCTAIGWSDNADNVARLQASVLRLKQATLILRRGVGDGEEGCTLGFVANFAWKGVQRWAVMLDPRIVGLFSQHFSYVNIEKRRLLSEGMQTWLYGIVCANNCLVPFSYERLFQASGSRAKDMKEFGRSVRTALTRMHELGVIAGFQLERGAVRILKIAKK